MTGGHWPRGHAARPGPAWTPADHRIQARAARGDPFAARRDLAAFISATRHARRQRALALTLSLLSALVLATAVGGWLLTNYVSSSLGRVNAGTAGTPAGGPMNILLAGIDVRAGLTRHQQALLHVGHTISDNSDTLLLIHIAASRRHVEVISLPRDSWVRIPGFGMNKINAAIGFGGPKLMVRTVERATGLAINDFAEVNFLGFVRVIDALGGVNICLPYAVHDAYSGLHLSAGVHHVNGITALQFARDRHSFALSDLARIANQHQLIASVITTAVNSGTLANPLRFSRFLSAITAAVKVDRNFNVLGLADQLRYLRPTAVSFVTVPLASMNYVTPSGASAVLWDRAAARRLFARVARDRPIGPRPGRTAPTRRTVPARRTPSGPPGADGSRPQTAAQAACR